MWVSSLNGCQITDEIAEEILFKGLEYNGENADVIMVLGSSKAPVYRVPAAAELLSEGKGEKLLLCGGKRQQTVFGFTEEYKAMAKAAKELDVPDAKILTECKSHTTEENFKYAEEVLKEKLPCCKKIILVTTAYHMRRSLLFAKEILPCYEFIPCPVHAGSATREVWKNSQKGRKTVVDECLKIGYYIRIGLIHDFQI